MSRGFDDARLGSVAALIAERLGLHFPSTRQADLARQLAQAGQRAGAPNLESYLDTLLAAPWDAARHDQLAAALTIGETHFYRDPQLFERIHEDFVPWMQAQAPARTRRFRLWSAGCCTGEEAYTLAIVFERLRTLYPDCEADLLATDVNPQFLDVARQGLYRPWSFRGTPPWLRQGYFATTADGRLAIRPELRARIRFAPLNLVTPDLAADPDRRGRMDLILCRHVLMYFSPEQFARTVHQLAQCLVEGGWLVLSAAEVSHVHEPSLVPTRFGDTTILVRHTAAKKRRTHVHAAPAVPAIQPLLPAPRPVAAPAPVAPPPAPAPTIAERLEQVRTQAGRNQLPEALGGCEAVLRTEPLNLAAHYLQATILQEQGNLTAAAAALTRVLYLDPDFIAAHVSLAHLTRRCGRPTEADRSLRTALELLQRLSPNQKVPESAGLTAGQLIALITSAGETQPTTPRPRRPARALPQGARA